MYILTLAGKEKEGAYSVTNEDGEQVLYLFEEEDDASRFAMMLEEKDYPELAVIEVDDDLMLKTCEVGVVVVAMLRLTFLEVDVR